MLVVKETARTIRKIVLARIVNTPPSIVAMALNIVLGIIFDP